MNLRYPDGLDDDLEELVANDQFTSKAQAIRYYIRSGLQREYVGDAE